MKKDKKIKDTEAKVAEIETLKASFDSLPEIDLEKELAEAEKEAPQKPLSADELEQGFKAVAAINVAKEKARK